MAIIKDRNVFQIAWIYYNALSHLSEPLALSIQLGANNSLSL